MTIPSAHITAILVAIVILTACEKPAEPIKPKMAIPELTCDAACRARVSTSGDGDFPEIDTSFPPESTPKSKKIKP